jgi:hypothetical protein
MPAKKQNWTSIKKQLQAQEPKETLKILGELYKLNRENKQFLDTRFSSSKEVLKEYIEAIQDALDPPLGRDMEVDFKSARKVISNYRKARKDDTKGIVELMLRFVESANDCTLRYGDMWEQFYINIETMYEKVIVEVKKMEGKGINIEHLQERLHEVMTSTSCIGWGYHDTLTELYFTAFDDE